MSRRSRATMPQWLWFPAGIAILLCAGPLAALLLEAPWTELAPILFSAASLTSLGLSVGTAAASTLICALLGLPAAIILSKLEGTWIQLLRGLLIVPLVLSPVVSGIALLYFWGRQGILGGWLESFGISVGFSPLAVIIVQVFVSLPFFVVAAMSSLRQVDPELELAAATLGAGPTTILRHVTLPLALPGVLVGVLLAFARSLGEYGATITFAGSIEGQTRTLPLQIELSLNSAEPQTALGISLMLVALYLLILTVAKFGVDRLLPRH